MSAASRSLVEVTRTARERAARALELRAQGKLLREIAAELGISEARVCQLLKKGRAENARRISNSEIPAQ